MTTGSGVNDTALAISADTFSRAGIIGIIITALSIYLFRRASLSQKSAIQMRYFLSAVAVGFAALMGAGGLCWGGIFLIGIGVFIWSHVWRKPSPRAFYQAPVYQSGLWYLVVLNGFASSAELIGMIIVTGLYLAGYLIMKTMVQSYE